MLALSIRQPWAHFITALPVDLRKPIENRDWPTRFRGRFLVHASKGMTRWEYDDAIFFAIKRCGVDASMIPAFDALPRGGLVGMANLVDCVTEHASPWFMGKYGFVMRDQQMLQFIPYRGQLGFFDVREPLP